MEDHTRDKNAWVRTFALIALIFSVVVAVIFLLSPVWEESDAVAAVLGPGGAINAEFLLAFLVVVALILSIVVISFAFAIAGKGHRKPILIFGLVAFVVVGGPLVYTLIYSAAVTNGS